ncbi:hypothetical protein [Streptomyces palmae]|uniref:Uncharacterized protein n=1 Tax=Streptomyces palmae TaxID=1701085 RepID=A0A4Z0FZL6_9ACTN|nr:hypothetical protein [Streptomyces palmae]TGA87668.1 hypothetical protein E4099_29930 [Streptomyces palmae]
MEKLDIRSVRDMSQETQKVSSGILDILSLKKGKVTEPGPGTLPCSGYSGGEEVRRMHHPWSVYDVPVEDLYEAMDRLRSELPKNGWKIIKDEPDRSRAKTPQIVANYTRGNFSADIRLLDQRKYRDKESLIMVTVVSDCFRSNESGSRAAG